MKRFPALLFASLVLALSAPARAEEAAVPEPSVTEVGDGTITRLELLHAEAAKLMDEGDPRAAVKLYLDILLIEPDDDAAYTNMGQAYLMLGDSGRAREAFLNALHIDPQNEIAMEGLDHIADPDGTLSGALHDADAGPEPVAESEVSPEPQPVPDSAS